MEKAVAYWLRHHATSRKVAGSRPDGVIEFFNVPNPSSRTRSSGFAQLLTEVSTRSTKIVFLGSRAWEEEKNLGECLQTYR
jgi:hypothetical protein